MERPGDSEIRVLVVDSDGGARDTLRAGIERADDAVDVLTADTVAAARTTVTDTRIDCLVTDGELADGSGIDLVRAVRERRPGLPVILSPRNGSESLAAAAVTARVDASQQRTGDATEYEELVAEMRRVVVEHTERQAALDRMTDAFFAVDTDWQFTYLNEEGRNLVNGVTDGARTVDDLRGAVIWDVIDGLEDTRFGQEYRNVIETQEPVSFEEFYEPLGRWFEVRAFPSPTGLSVYFKDITERKRDRERLERREAVLTRMYRVVADKDRTFEQKVEELLSIGREELDAAYGTLSRIEGTDYHFEVVVSPAGDDTVAAGDVVPLSWTSCERAVTTEESLVVADMADEPELARRQGNVEIGIRCYLGAPVVVNETVTGTFCFYDDNARAEPFSNWQVTLVELMANWVSYERERKQRAEELTRERNRMEEFASMVSHDLRSPLSVATARLELVADDCDSEHLDDVESALDRMEELIDDVLALARLGRQVVDRKPLEFETVVNEAWSTTSSGTGSLVVEDDIDTVVADGSRLRQLFENLFRNAVEHGSTSNRTESDDAMEHVGDGVTVRVGPLSGGGFYVEDDGPGIPEDERDQVFESGYTTERDGTGFGLNIVREIVEAHGGAISLTESDEGGARFEITGIETR